MEEISLKAIEEHGVDLSTFTLRGYMIEGTEAIHPESHERIKIEGIYPEIRNVRNAKREIFAKRKNPEDILRQVKIKKKR
ncbi:hypothetical protein bmyco0003_54280 [Bacillus pseudomycoides]|nr:hypothetical protein [Bacillus pseudomycoides]EEM02112.1 hypothetical protein bmyco0002_55550 [Bacillus pseudomycoides]EEM07891.1 hypothetical protein bmyco0003_54280 [Bacillus pseudomycoides]PDZ12703.1 hypothetical protein CON70_04870 [Bacillus pseudomycoides]PDZ71231.1 hypothetical protein CON58_24510 [Bacillus pseudomycoides]PEF22131.1 hypothetical protein CON69_23945 [Bacillus pseudomycoides]